MSAIKQTVVPVVVHRRGNGWSRNRYGAYLILDAHRFHEVRGGRTINAVLLGVIAVNIIALVMESEQGFAARFGSIFRLVEVVSITIFSIEYIARLWSCADDPRYSDGLRGRLRYARTPMAIVDLLAIAPFFLGGFVDLRFLRSLRLFRIFRIVKLARYSEAMQIFAVVVRGKRAEMTVIGAFLAILVLCFGSLMFILENSAQPERFASISSSMWWAVVTLTTIGYGDAVPVTAAGKAIGGIVAVFGIGMFALPAGMLGAAFSEAIAARNRAAGACPTCGAGGEKHAFTARQEEV